MEWGDSSPISLNSRSTAREKDNLRGRMVDTTKYKSIAIRIPYYDALVRLGESENRGPGQQMMYLIKTQAKEKGLKIKEKRKNGQRIS
jgi:hypothetical protein